jgi:hypothetical protein
MDQDTIQYADGGTFAFREEIALFLERFTVGRSLIHFAFILHLLKLLRGHGYDKNEGIARFHAAFTRAGRSLANAGALCAILCRDVPGVAEPVDVRQLLDRLRNRTMPVSWYVVTFNVAVWRGEEPPLGPWTFELRVLEALAAYTNEELEAWFRHGRSSVQGAGEAVADQLAPPPPRTLAGALAALLERPRLAGARPFVDQLLSALALPPRRLVHQEMPVGGYADVVTHGNPDQILPSQFALDEWEFFRRFAERELLYFRREEPHAQTKHELVVLLDQGVRTWGDVRLVLTAAVLALGRQADRRRTRFLLAATSVAGPPMDPLQVDDETLGRLVDASDLSANPGLALEGVLERPADGDRDVVLLTHPRNLREEDVTAAARRVGPGTRLFSLALDGAGEADLSELRHGVPVKVRHFRVDFSVPAPPPPARPAARPGTALPWLGDVEPIGFPFRFGLGSPVQKGLFAFDDAGEWLLTVSGGGMLHAWKTDGSGTEVLPRGMCNGCLLTRIDAVLGVAGGFVVGGTVNRALTALHYDFAARTCTAHLLGDALPLTWWWSYSRVHHTVVTHTPSAETRYALDLGTGIVHSAGQATDSPRVAQAVSAAVLNQLPARRLRILTDEDFNEWSVGSLPASEGGDSKKRPFLHLDPDRGELDNHWMTPPWQPFAPLADGQPALKGCRALEAQCCGNTLAVKTSYIKRPYAIMLRLFRGPEGVPLAEYEMAHWNYDFVLSPDGRYLARQVERSRLEVRPVGDGTGPVFQTRVGGFAHGFSQHYHFILGDRWLLLGTGKNRSHLIRWDRGTLELRYSGDSPMALINEQVGLPPQRGGLAVPGTRSGLPRCAGAYGDRFILGAETTVIAISDRFGQVAILDSQQMPVCMFFAFRGQIAAWMPDGTCHGPASLTGAAPTPGAPERIGRALLEASEKGGRA